MIRIPLLALGTALLVSSCASRYTTLPADSGPSPDPTALVKAMSVRLKSAKQFRFTATNTIARETAAATQQQQKNETEVFVSRPDKLDARIRHQGTLVREMIYDGTTFTVVDGINNFYSKAPLRGTLDTAVAQLTKIYGFQPPLAEFVVSDPYLDLRRRVQAFAYLGKGKVREAGGVVQCHRISLTGQLADAELWLGITDNLPRRLKITRSNSGGKDLLVDVDFLTWDLNPQVSSSQFRHQPPAGAVEIPMVTVAEANAVPN